MAKVDGIAMQSNIRTRHLIAKYKPLLLSLLNPPQLSNKLGIYFSYPVLVSLFCVAQGDLGLHLSGFLSTTYKTFFYTTTTLLTVVLLLKCFSDMLNDSEGQHD